MRRLRSNLDAVMTAQRIKNTKLATELGLTRNHVSLIRRGQFDAISRKELTLLMRWMSQHGGGQPLFELVDDPVWSTFESKQAVILRGAARADARLESVVTDWLATADCEADPHIGKKTARKLVDLMRARNCVFLGSPAGNPNTGVALRELLSVSRSKKEAVPPFRFAWPAWAQHESRGPFEFQDPEGRTGLFLDPHRKGRFDYLIEVDQRKPKDYQKWEGEGWDAGVVIVCRRPFDTQEDVTTIIMAGYTALSTIQIGEHLSGGTVPIGAEDLGPPGSLAVRYLSFSYRKTGRNDRVPRKANLKWFRPPWKDLLAASRREASRVVRLSAERQSAIPKQE